MKNLVVAYFYTHKSYAHICTLMHRNFIEQNKYEKECKNK
jgi:hypothetical protein